jgi:hypothetical protein
MPCTGQVRRVWLEMSRIAPSHRIEIVEHLQKARNILWGPPMYHIQIPCSVGYSLDNRRSHSDDDDFDSCVSEPKEYFVKLGFGCHGESA